MDLLPFQALNNLQSTFQGFGHVNSENVFKVCYDNITSYWQICLTIAQTSIPHFRAV